MFTALDLGLLLLVIVLCSKTLDSKVWGKAWDKFRGRRVGWLSRRS